MRISSIAAKMATVATNLGSKLEVIAKTGAESSQRTASLGRDMFQRTGTKEYVAFAKETFANSKDMMAAQHALTKAAEKTTNVNELRLIRDTSKDLSKKIWVYDPQGYGMFKSRDAMHTANQRLLEQMPKKPEALLDFAKETWEATSILDLQSIADTMKKAANVARRSDAEILKEISTFGAGVSSNSRVTLSRFGDKPVLLDAVNYVNETLLSFK